MAEYYKKRRVVYIRVAYEIAATNEASFDLGLKLCLSDLPFKTMSSEGFLVKRHDSVISNKLIEESNDANKAISRDGEHQAATTKDQ